MHPEQHGSHVLLRQGMGILLFLLIFVEDYIVENSHWQKLLDLKDYKPLVDG
jgi:hypothetical protein